MALILCAGTSALLFLLRDTYWPLAWVAPLPLLWLAYGHCSFKQLLLTTMTSVLLWQGISATPLLSADGIAILPLLAGQIVMIVVKFIVCISAARYAERIFHPILTLLMYPAISTGITYLFMMASDGDSFGNVAYTQVDVPVLIQSAALFGLHGIEFILGLFVNGLALTLRRPKQTPFYLGTAAIVVIANVVYGFFRMQAPASEMMRVAASAQDLPLTSRLPMGVEAVSSFTKAYADEGRRLANLGAKVIVFPELVAVLTPQLRAQALAPLQSLANESGASISIGFMEVDANELIHNVAYTFKRDNGMVRYVKRHTLVPLDLSVRGTGNGILGNGVALAICKDLDFPATIRSDAQQNIRLMIVPAADFKSDGWIHARMSIMRGVENGFAVVRAARNGLVTISDDRGRVIARDGTNATNITHVIADVSLGSRDTLYRRIGDSFAWVCIALSIVCLVMLYRSRQRFLASDSGHL